MKKFAIASVLSLAGMMSVANAGEQVTYTTGEYCALEKSGYKSKYQKRYLKAYAEKLGTTPSRDFCKQLRAEQFAGVTKAKHKWNFHMRKPYAGSVRRLSAKVVKKIKLNRALAQDVIASR